MIVTTSWDDGHVLDMKLAELLNRYDLAGTFYIAPANRQIQPEQRLSREKIKALSEKYEIGAHTMTHPKLSEVDDATAQREMTESKKTLEDWTGKAVTSFCYPSGDFRPKHETMAKNAGFSLARTVERFKTDLGNDAFAVPTTVHAYRHLSDIALIFSKKYFNWDDLAIDLFEKTKKENGIFHLWGHSWEIEKNGDWKRLERVFAHIAHHADIEYRINANLI